MLDLRKQIVIVVLQDLIDNHGKVVLLPDLMEIQHDTETGKKLLDDYAKQIIKLLKKENKEK